MTELRGCPNPWCLHEWRPTVQKRIAAQTYSVQCGGCGMDGPSALTSDEAIAAWNTRALRTDDRTTEPSDAAIKALWRKHGGGQHGPMVEQYYIEERAFYRFARDLLAPSKETE